MHAELVVLHTEHFYLLHAFCRLDIKLNLKGDPQLVSYPSLLSKYYEDHPDRRPAETRRNRFTSVIANIERHIAEQHEEELEYEQDEGFIDDTERVAMPASVRTKYGEFFVHSGKENIAVEGDEEEANDGKEISGGAVGGALVSGTSSRGAFSKKVSEAIRKLEAAYRAMKVPWKWKKGTKELPEEIRDLLLDVCDLVVEDQGFVPQQVFQELSSFLPVKPRSLQLRIDVEYKIRDVQIATVELKEAKEAVKDYVRTHWNEGEASAAGDSAPDGEANSREAVSAAGGTSIAATKDATEDAEGSQPAGVNQGKVKLKPKSKFTELLFDCLDKFQDYMEKKKDYQLRVCLRSCNLIPCLLS